MIRILILLLLLLPALSEASTLPRQFGKFHLRMTVSEAARITGEELFSGTCASCPEGSDEVPVSPKYFTWFSDVFPGLVVDTWMPNDAVILMTTKDKVTGFVIGFDKKVKDPLTILSKRLGKPKTVKGSGFVTRRWRDSMTAIEYDDGYNSIRIYDRRYYPHLR